MHRDFGHCWSDDLRVRQYLHKPRQLFIGIPERVWHVMFQHPIGRIVDEEIRQMEGVGNVLPMLLGCLRVTLHEGPSVFLAGGFGITPFRGMLRYAADTGSSASKRLLYSARVPEEFIFRAELDELSRTHPEFRVQYTVTRPTESALSWSGRVGRISEAWIREVSEPLDRPKFYVAGLPEMVEQTVSVLGGRLRVPEDDIDYEVFRGF